MYLICEWLLSSDVNKPYLTWFWISIFNMVLYWMGIYHGTIAKSTTRDFINEFVLTIININLNRKDSKSLFNNKNISKIWIIINILTVSNLCPNGTAARCVELSLCKISTAGTARKSTYKIHMTRLMNHWMWAEGVCRVYEL